jgi:uncharacterized membrane protein (UPF0127 family)
VSRIHLVAEPLTVNGTVTAHRVWRASTWVSRARGLLGTTRLDDPCGLWLDPCACVHMIGMRYSIDVVFVRGDGTVIEVVGALKPWRVAFSLRSQAVLELRAGMTGALGLRPGMRVGLGAPARPAADAARTAPG